MDKSRKPVPDRLAAVTVELTIAELAAVSRAGTVVTSSGDVSFVNAADRALRKLRAAAARHPDLPEEARRKPLTARHSTPW
jgi:hypothetical protein